MCCNIVETLDNGKYSVHTQHKWHMHAWCAFGVVLDYGIAHWWVVGVHPASVTTWEALDNKVLRDSNVHIMHMLDVFLAFRVTRAVFTSVGPEC